MVREDIPHKPTIMIFDRIAAEGRMRTEIGVQQKDVTLFSFTLYIRKDFIGLSKEYEFYIQSIDWSNCNFTLM